MKKIYLLLSGLLLLLGTVACSGGPGGPTTEPTTSATTAVTDAETETADTPPQFAAQLSIYNWADYIDSEIISAYQAEYGVTIIYDTFASNEDLLAKLQAGATGYDIIFPSDYMVSQMIELGLLAEIDINNIPNFANISDDFKNAPFDPGNKHCVPYQWGTSGIAYRAGNAFFEENTPDSWAYLFEPTLLQQYSADGINVLDDSRELIAAALVYLGYDGNSVNPDEIAAARNLILAAKPYWKTFNSSDYEDALMVPDEVVLSHSWSGDAAGAYWETYDEATEDGNWHYAIPQEGAVKWLDNICITASSTAYDTAVHFMNYLLDAEVGAAITNYTYYASPNKAAQDYILAEILEDPGIYPPDEVQEKLYWLVEVGDGVFLYDEAWTAIKGQ